MSWTEERIATLKRLWEGGATASQIADELTGVSRNAVIGKAHRLGLKARPSPVKVNENKAKSASVAAESIPVKPPVTEATADAAAPSASPEEARSAPARKEPKPTTDSAADDTPWTDGDGDDPAAAFLVRAEAKTDDVADADPNEEDEAAQPASRAPSPRIVSVGPGGFLRQGPGDQQAPIPPAPPRRLVPAKPSQEVADKTSLLDLNDKICRWPMGHPGEPDFHFCGEAVNPGFPYCVEHCGRAYQAQLPRGARRPPPPLPFGGPRVR